MTDYSYDPDAWLTSTTRVLGAYVRDSLQAIDAIGEDLEVEMSFPDTSSWTKPNPLDHILIHFELDDKQHPILGMGIPGVETVDKTDAANPISLFAEAARHRLNFDVGIWISAEMGGASKRMQVAEALTNLLHPAGAREAFNVATAGLNIVSFDGGQDALDRINDVPIWRTMSMTLMLDVFSRHVQEPGVVPTDIFLNPTLTLPS